MKKLLIGLLALASLSAFSSEVPNQSCSGKNKLDNLVKTELFVNKDLNSAESNALLKVSVEEEQIEIPGTITNEADFSGARMFKSNDDKFRYLTAGIFDSKSGSLFSIDYRRFNLEMECTKFKF